MQKRLDKLEEKIDLIVDKLHDQNVTLARNTESLILHEKRTDIAEQKLNLLENEYKEHSTRDMLRLENIESKLDPIYKHVTVVNTAFKYIIPAVAGILGFLFKIGIIKF